MIHTGLAVLVLVRVLPLVDTVNDRSAMILTDYVVVEDVAVLLSFAVGVKSAVVVVKFAAVVGYVLAAVGFAVVAVDSAAVADSAAGRILAAAARSADRASLCLFASENFFSAPLTFASVSNACIRHTRGLLLVCFADLAEDRVRQPWPGVRLLGHH